MGKGKYNVKAYSSFTREQASAIDSLIGKYGVNRSDVVRTITICWLERKSLLSNKKNPKSGK